MHVKNGSKDLKRYPQISRRVRDTLARLFLARQRMASLRQRELQLPACLLLHASSIMMGTRDVSVACMALGTTGGHLTER